MFAKARRLANPVARTGATIVFRRAASARFIAAVKTSPHPVKVAIGCADTTLPGWICTEYDLWQSHRFFLDAAKPWPIDPSSVDFVYGDNVVEHLTLGQARAFLKAAFIALAPGGVVRLVTPDLERIARAYLDDPDMTTEHLERHRRHGYPIEHSADMLRVTYAYHGHHAGYVHDYASLSTEFAAAGYVDIKRAETSESEVPELRGLEQRTEPTDRASSLVIEATRP